MSGPSDPTSTAKLVSRARRAATESPGSRASTSAATPVTCGAAIDVPSANAYTGCPATKSHIVDSTPKVPRSAAVGASEKSPPGAAMSTVGPYDEYEASRPSGPTADTDR